MVALPLGPLLLSLHKIVQRSRRHCTAGGYDKLQDNSENLKSFKIPARF